MRRSSAQVGLYVSVGSAEGVSTFVVSDGYFKSVEVNILLLIDLSSSFIYRYTAVHGDYNLVDGR